MKKTILTIALLILTLAASAQLHGIRVNTLGWLSGNINIGFETKINNHYSFDVMLYGNPIKTQKVSMLNVTVQPAIKYWFYNTYVGHYVDISSTVGYYNVGRKRLKEGLIAGLGAGYGYNWVLSKHINIGLEGGFGFYYLKYRDAARNVHYTEDEYIYHHKKVMFLPSRIECSLIYFF